MAFGAFTGRGGGLIGQKPYGLSQMFAGLSEGLADFAKMRQSSDLEESRLKHDDARTAADHAFQDNLARFHVKAQEEHDIRAEGAADEREQRQAGVQSSHWDQEHADRQASEKRLEESAIAEQKYRAQMLANSAEGKAQLAEQRKQHAEEFKALADKAKADADRADAQGAAAAAKEMLDGPKFDYQSQAKETAAMVHATPDLPQRYAAYQADLKANAKTPLPSDLAAYADSLNDLGDKKSRYEDAQKAAKPLLDKAGSIYLGGGSRSAAGKDAATTAAPDPLAALSPDKQEYAKRAMAADPTMTADKAAAAANAAPPAMIQKALSRPAPVAKPPQASVDQAPGAFAQGDGTAAVPTATGAVETQPETGQTGVISGGPSQYTTAGPEMTGPPAASPDASGAPPAPTGASAQPDASAPQPDASATAQAAPAQPDPATQFAGMADSLNKTPEGQGVITTLGRLAESKEGPVADKMRRAAEIQLQDQFPNQDASGFIDYYLDQNAQEVA